MTEDEMVGWHHQLSGHGFGWTPGVGDGQGGLACCSSWGHKQSDRTERMNGTELKREKENQEHLLKTQILQRQWLITIESQRCVPASKLPSGLCPRPELRGSS